ncbi:MAG: MerR family transcriptional regulator [Candidatus Adiutrix sp.]|jgi:DNA-binding transcriptional MerR regulator|nr:MerR family transcriptional regulator [Candidatus Adiutrix sp.]
MTHEAEQVFYKLTELSELLGVETSVLRFWEKEFERFIKPLKVGPRKKLYRRRDLEVFQEIKRLLYEERFTIAGALKHLEKAGGGRQDSLFEEGGDRLGDATAPAPPPGVVAAELKALKSVLAETRRDLLALRAFLTRRVRPDQDREPGLEPPPAKARPKAGRPSGRRAARPAAPKKKISPDPAQDLPDEH